MAQTTIRVKSQIRVKSHVMSLNAPIRAPRKVRVTMAIAQKYPNHEIYLRSQNDQDPVKIIAVIN